MLTKHAASSPDVAGNVFSLRGATSWSCLFTAVLVALQSDEKTAGVANEVFPRSQRWPAVGSGDVMLRFILSQMWDIPT